MISGYYLPYHSQKTGKILKKASENALKLKFKFLLETLFVPLITRKYLTNKDFSSLFHMKITASGTKNLHQDRGQCYLHLPIFPYTYSLLSYWKIKRCCDRRFPQHIRPQTIVQLYILQDYFSVRVT